VGEDAPVTKRATVSTTDAEIDAAIERGRKYDEHATKIVRAEYDRERDQISAALSTGASITVPRRSLPRFDLYTPADFGAITIEPPGYALWFDTPDIGVRLEGLLRAAGGEALIRSIAAQAMGSSKSEKKAEAARKNGSEGGRPAKNAMHATRIASSATAGGKVAKGALKPDAAAPRSGQYQIIGPRGESKKERTIVRGEPLPPTPSPGTSYELRRPGRNQAGNKK
jgi:hypothetical protein